MDHTKQWLSKSDQKLCLKFAGTNFVCDVTLTCYNLNYAYMIDDLYSIISSHFLNHIDKSLFAERVNMLHGTRPHSSSRKITSMDVLGVLWWVMSVFSGSFGAVVLACFLILLLGFVNKIDGFPMSLAWVNELSCNEPPIQPCARLLNLLGNASADSSFVLPF